ncbi:MAG: hypothetical protein ACI9AR_000484 [Flavobacteriaceae bacterium]|jgi:hypothetical protein
MKKISICVVMALICMSFAIDPGKNRIDELLLSMIHPDVIGMIEVQEISSSSHSLKYEINDMLYALQYTENKTVIFFVTKTERYKKEKAQTYIFSDYNLDGLVDYGVMNNGEKRFSIREEDMTFQSFWQDKYDETINVSCEKFCPKR